eukprot:gene4783-6852_t
MSLTSKRRMPPNIGLVIHNMQEILKISRTAVPFQQVLNELELHELSSNEISKIRNEIQARNCKLLLEDDYIQFQPTYDVRNKQDLLNLIKEFDAKGLGGIILDELEDSYEGVRSDVCDLVDKNLVYKLENKAQRFSVLFYKDPKYHVNIDKAISEKWRLESISGKPDKEIKQELLKKGKQPLRIQKAKEERTTHMPKSKTSRRKQAEKRSKLLQENVEQMIHASKKTTLKKEPST